MARDEAFRRAEEKIEEARRTGATELDAYIFPVRLAECEIPAIEIDDTRTLDRIQHIDLFPASKRSAGLQKLLASLAAAPEHP